MEPALVVTLIVAFMGGTATVSAAVIPQLIRMRKENRADHNRVIEALVKLTTQVAVLERDLALHVQWEESQKYVTGPEIRALFKEHDDRIDQAVDRVEEGRHPEE